MIPSISSMSRSTCLRAHEDKETSGEIRSALIATTRLPACESSSAIRASSAVLPLPGPPSKQTPLVSISASRRRKCSSSGRAIHSPAGTTKSSTGDESFRNTSAISAAVGSRPGRRIARSGPRRRSANKPSPLPTSAALDAANWRVTPATAGGVSSYGRVKACSMISQIRTRALFCSDSESESRGLSGFHAAWKAAIHVLWTALELTGTQTMTKSPCSSALPQ